MPKHDLPDGNESGDNVIDFRLHLGRRIDLRPREDRVPEPTRSDRETFRYAEHGDGRRARFSRHDLLLLGMLGVVGWLLWELVLR